MTEGSYRLIRHPMYASIFLIVAEVWFLPANWIAALSYMLPAISLYIIQIPDEEKMIERFGDEYRETMWNTGRLISNLSLFTK